MPDDASLEDFLDADATGSEADGSADETSAGGDSDADAASADGEGDQPAVGEEAQSATDGEAATPDDEGGGHVSTDAVDPATPTCDWTDGGAACAACGTVVERRWRDEAGLVCGECKDW